MAVSSVTDLTGRVLAGRYRLLAPIGTGASGRVYRAEDARLRREVAVKVLHLALAEDAGFLRRFRAEAQLAASLSHPHVMTVYDWGEDEVPFMAVELLQGGSLRGMLDAGNQLSPAQAARVGRDVARALEYAHTRGIVHRDIKPANLLFDEHGIVRVADFGLARALAEASWTEPAGAVLGTARYASPEQAIGSPVDARSDLYSLALVIVESVTGRVPFASDTTVGTLTARTQRPIVAPDEMGPLKAVVERAGRIDPGERYGDAATMASALADAADALPRPSPLILAGAVDGADLDPTHTAAAAATASTGPFDQDAEPTRTLTEPVVITSTAERRLVPFAVALVVALAVIGGVAMLLRTGGASAAVPGVVGRTETSASKVVGQGGLDLRVSERVESDEPRGTVLSQHPSAGDWTTGDTVTVVVSDGPALVEVPKLDGGSVGDALLALEKAGLVADVSEGYSDDVARGNVISQTPPVGTQIRPDTSIEVVVSKGPKPVPVPAVSGAGSTYEDAAGALRAARLVPVRAEQYSDSVPVDEVIGTDPGPGQSLPPGSEVKVFVSLGPELVKVPNVLGLDVQTASERLSAAGFDDVSIKGSALSGRVVVRQDPDGGERVRKSTPVTLRLGSRSLL